MNLTTKKGKIERQTGQKWLRAPKKVMGGEPRGAREWWEGTIKNRTLNRAEHVCCNCNEYLFWESDQPATATSINCKQCLRLSLQ